MNLPRSSIRFKKNGSEVQDPTQYSAPFWLPGGNLQTIYPYLIKPVTSIHYRRERWELEDGDFIDVDWLDGPIHAPLVVLFHGLEGNSKSHYVLSLMDTLQKKNWRGAVIHFRGCSGLPNRLPRAYHAGDSDEINWMLHRIFWQGKLLDSETPLYTIGVSLGGNALLKWLGEQDEKASQIITAAAAISVPLDLSAAGAALVKGFNQFYTRHFLSTLKHKMKEKLDRFPDLLDAQAIAACKTLYEFDNLATAPLHGFCNTEDYWEQSSSKPWLKHIRVPTLVINARNDPFMPPSALPTQEEVSPAVTLAFPKEGGHAGFIQAPFPGKLSWLPNTIFNFLQSPGNHK